MASKILSYYDDDALAAKYIDARLSFPQIVVDKILEYVSSQRQGEKQQKFGKMLDVACGSGQSSTVFAPYFESVLGVDISESQIKVGRKNTKETNVTYQVIDGTNWPVDDGTIDLVNCSTAIHWLNLNDFTAECMRVLKPGGCAVAYNTLAVWVRTPDAPPPPNFEWNETWLKLLRKFHEDIKAHPRNELWMQYYRPVFEEIPCDTKCWLEGIWYEKECTLTHIRNFWSTKGEYHILMKESHPDSDPLEVLMNGVKKMLNVEGKEEADVKIIITEYLPTVAFNKTIEK